MQTTYRPDPTPGVAAFEEVGEYQTTLLLSGAEPPLKPSVGIVLKAGVTVKQYQPLGINADNELDIAVEGVLPAEVISTEAMVGDGVQKLQVWYSGCFNPAKLKWDASYDTDEKKEFAFRKASQPTTILVKKRLV